MEIGISVFLGLWFALSGLAATIAVFKGYK